LERIAYVILTWNSSAYIGQCVASIWGIPSLGAQIIVVDNGSRDGTRELLKRLEAGCPRHCTLEVVENPENLGTAVARNQGLALVEPGVEFVCILDSDTQVNRQAMEALLRELKAHPGYGLVGPRMASGDGKEQLSGRNLPTLPEKLFKAIPLPFFQALGEAMEKPRGYGSPEPYPVGYLMSACWLFPKALLGEAGYLDEKIFYAPEDAEYCLRVWKAGRQVVFCPGARILHHWQRLSRKKRFSRINWEHLKGLAHLFWKHRYCFRPPEGCPPTQGDGPGKKGRRG
jgi:GT2 family glycosyltransferase